MDETFDEFDFDAPQFAALTEEGGAGDCAVDNSDGTFTIVSVCVICVGDFLASFIFTWFRPTTPLIRFLLVQIHNPPAQASLRSARA